MNQTNEPELAPSLLDLVVLVLRHRRWMAGIGLVFGLVTAVAILLQPREYSSIASFMPRGGEGQFSRLSGLAAQLGMLAPVSSGTQSAEFFAELAGSRLLGAALADEEFRFATADSSRAGTLADLLEVEAPNPARRVEATIKEIRQRLRVATSVRTGVVTLTAATPWPALSQAIVQRALDLLNRQNLALRQAQAAGERGFVEGRLRQLELDLREADGNLQRFLSQNRDFKPYSPLTLERDRLQRELDRRQSLYARLAEAYEQARIDEVRNTAVIVTVSPPFLPAAPDSRGLVFSTLLAVMVGAVAGGSLGYARERLQAPAAEQSLALRRVLALWRDVRADLRRLWPGRSGAAR